MADNDNVLGMLCHLLAIFFGWLPPLIIWLIKRNDDPGVDENGKNVLNFLITVFVVSLVLFILMTVTTSINALSLTFMLLWLGVVITSKVLLIIGTIKSYQDGVYEYPFWSHYPLIK